MLMKGLYLVWLGCETQGMTRNLGHHVGFGKFRDQKIFFMRKTLHSFEDGMAIASITLCRRSFHVKCKDFLLWGKGWEVFKEKARVCSCTGSERKMSMCFIHSSSITSTGG